MDRLLWYLRVLLTFVRNSLVRDMTFRANFLIDTFSSIVWTVMNFGFYLLIFSYTPMLGRGTGWGRYEFFVFLATTLLINSLVRGLFLANADQFSEQIRTGTLDFALLKPIDTQFLISFGRIEWAATGPMLCGLALLVYSLGRVEHPPGVLQGVLFVFFILCSVGIFYSVMISMAATSVWLGRNQTLLDFWFYLNNFARYPMEIYQKGLGWGLVYVFTYLIPVLVAVNVPARLLAKPFHPTAPADWLWPGVALAATAMSLAVSRWIFTRSLLSYRSASS